MNRQYQRITNICKSNNGVNKIKYCFLLLVFTLFAQNTDNLVISENSGVTGCIGTVTINGEVYNQLSLRPVIPIGKLDIGLDLYLYFNDEGMYWESWDFSNGETSYRTIIDKIYYLQWGQPEDNLYGIVGALPSVTLGQGILINNYSNLMEYPQVRQVGLNLKAKVAGVRLELIHSNFKTTTPGIIGVRGSYALLPKLSIGASAVSDLDQMSGLPDSDGDNYPDYYDDYPDDESKYNEAWEIYLDNSDAWEEQFYCSGSEECLQPHLIELLGDTFNDYDPELVEKDPISGMALDVAYTLNEKITLFSQVAFLRGEINNPNYLGDDSKLGWGLVPLGAKVKLGYVNLLTEYRMSSERFIFSYWDRAYDVNRVSVDTSGITTRENQLYLYGILNGFYAHADMGFMDLFNLGIGYQNMQGGKWDEESNEYRSGETNQAFLASIGVNPSLIPKVGKAEAFYQQSNVPNPFEFEPNGSTIWGYNFGIEVSSGVMLVYKNRTTYISDLENEGQYKSIELIQIETQFIF